MYKTFIFVALMVYKIRGFDCFVSLSKTRVNFNLGLQCGANV